MVLLNKACCCFQLSTSAVLLGWLGAAGYFVVITGMLTQLSSTLFKDDFWDVVEIVIILVVLFISIINLLGCVCLMVGTMKKIRHLILPWLIGEIAFILFLGFCFVGFLIECIMYSRLWAISQLVTTFVFLLFQVYVWACVYSLYQELREKDAQKLGVETTKSTTLKDNMPPYSSFA